MKTKICNGHFCQGEYRPLSEFYIHGSGSSKGKPFFQCKRCYRWRKNIGEKKDEESWTPEERFRHWQPYFEGEVEKRRTRIVKVPFGRSYLDIIDPKLFTLQECQLWARRGFRVPYDLVPTEYWWLKGSGIPRCGEEALGDEF